MAERITVQIGTHEGAEVAPDLWGLFIEDLNDALDGGLNAERVRNGDFEFNAADRESWHALTGWTATPADRAAIREDAPVHRNNTHHVRLTGPVTLVNEGYDAAADPGERLRFSCFARTSGEGARLVAALGGEPAELDVAPGDWHPIEADLDAAGEGRQALRLEIPAGSVIDLDCVSLRPIGTDGRALTFRPDLLQSLKDLAPSFIRFPGGCVAHGLGLENLYHWKDTIGPRHERAQIPNVWGYHQSRQIGYVEYFELCQATGATPVPIVAAGVCCQNYPGGAVPIPDAEMDQYVHDVLDLVEFANGDTDTTWGARRAELGHPEPFGLRYLGVGNEDQITDDFRDRYARIEDALRAAHPEITVIGTTGPQPAGPDYEAGWAYARERGTDMVDEHGYMNPRWFHQNLDRYAAYDPTESKVYIGEYAARSNTVRSALAEAAYMVGLERRPDVVRLASYAPLLARVGHTQWVPDLIYFTADEVLPSASYFVQRMFAEERGTRLHPVAVEGAPLVPVAIPAAGTVKLRSGGSEVEYADMVLDGRPLPDARTGPGDEGVPLGGIDPSSCELAFTATRRAGEEGFTMVLGPEAPQSFLEMHIGAWQNKSTTVVRSDDGVSCDIHGGIPWSGVRTGEPVRIAVRLDGPRVRLWVDGQLRHDFEQDLRPEERVVAGAASRTAADGSQEYVVRVVNAQRERRTAAVALPGPGGPVTAVVRTLAGAGPDEGAPHAPSPVVPEDSKVHGEGGVELDLPPWSLTVAVLKAG
ncbi:alpha-L-arabinofuranosidase C-terminal domain-containing protein [Glycomyces buryatensis]|uniref:non-reducing end alpha-L-arabinofuranosidase n=1 Tax=Glycomyces buryatensis TaxID=2570927 RepID=A0A4S8QKM5_9ACTN|nr:alpha-L-arabinofuranosidase C-terminal domain-containing protein [Glycomyces buryatensis]THV43555.1 alpha-N-arabinofuranosidase [Glycomyces buryatensis]